MKSILYFILLCSFCSCMFLNSTQRKYYHNASKIKPIDVVIVPGLPLYNGKIDTLLKSRILWSEFLYNKGVVSTILYSGDAVYTPWVEGESMAILGKQTMNFLYGMGAAVVIIGALFKLQHCNGFT